MDLGEIFGDAFVYPLHNIKSLVVFAILGIIGAIIGGASIIGILGALGSTGWTEFAFSGLGIVGIIVFVLILFLIAGYSLDIIKYGIERRVDGPEIDIGRQIANTIKLIIVDVVYYVVPAILVFVLGLFLRNWLMSIISIIVFIVFALANFMAKCRLAKTENIGEALAIGEAIGDISRVGILKIIATVVILVIIAFVALIVIGWINRLSGIVGSILLGIFVVYFLFFYNRAIGLLYSDV